MSADVILIGGGHNGLAAAATLARAGRKVVVLERRDVLGGLAADDEFVPGYRNTGVLTETCGVRPEVVESLRLTDHGLRFAEREAPVLALDVAGEKGPGLLLHADEAAMVEELSGFSSRDAEAWPRWQARLARLRPFVARVFGEAAPDPDDATLGGRFALARTGLALRRLGKRDMAELLRIGPMCAADWLGEWFETPLLRGALAAPALTGTWMGPWSAGSAANLLVHECTRGRSVVGGPAALVDALAAAARTAGAELRTDAAVEQILLDGGRVSGVRLAGGEIVSGSTVAATCDPTHTFLSLVAVRDLPAVLERRALAWRTRGTTARLDLALSGPPTFTGRPNEVVSRVRFTGGVDDLERAFDAVKYGRYSDTPFLDVSVPTYPDPSRAPEGHHVLSALVHFAPYHLAGGWTDERADALQRTVLNALARHVDGLTDLIVGARLLTPADIEQRYGLTGGHVHHGEHALDQLLHMRPAPECAGYATPIGGLYLCGSGSHPGGGITCAPGWLGARAILGS